MSEKLWRSTVLGGVGDILSWALPSGNSQVLEMKIGAIQSWLWEEGKSNLCEMCS